MALSISQLSERLGVSPNRARNLVAHGVIKGERVGNQWVVEEAEAAKYQPRMGRPLSAVNAWRLALYSSGDQIPDAHPMERSRLREHLASLRQASDPAAKLCSLLARRADKVEYSVSPADLADLRDDPRIRLSGVSHPDSGLLSNSEIEGYVNREDLDSLVREWFLVKARPGQRPNVLLHVAEDLPHSLPALFIAADLAERAGVRERQAARDLIVRSVLHAG